MVKPEPSNLREYAVQAIQPRLERMLSHLEGAKEGAKTEPIKQMRVWSRRTRAAVEVFYECFPGKAFKGFEKEIKTVTGALGQARDLDVMIDTLTKREAGLPPQQRGGLASFIAQLQAQREEAQEAVRETVAHLEHKDLLARFQVIAEAVPETKKEAPVRADATPKPDAEAQADPKPSKGKRRKGHHGKS
jgi:triphosphatase